MNRFHALRLALLCCALVAVLAACGSGSSVQPNYGSLANEICGTWTATVQTNPGPTQRLQAIETALSGLQGLNPPSTVTAIYTRLLYHFKAAADILKSNMQTLARIGKRLNTHPGDKAAMRQYATIVRRIRGHLTAAAAAAHTLGLGRCEAAFNS